MPLDIVFGVAVLAFSAILHEVAHGYMANWLGDPTARLQGRLTLNPLKHIDPVGSVILPALLVLTHSPILVGYARPVPYNPYNFSKKYGELLVAGAGPATNFLLAALFALVLRAVADTGNAVLVGALGTVVLVNLMLGLFNLIPIPPLDGSKVLQGILPGRLARGYERLRYRFEQLGFFTGLFIVLLFFYLLSPYFAAFLGWIFRVMTGIDF